MESHTYVYYVDLLTVGRNVTDFNNKLLPHCQPGGIIPK